ncbi:MAG: acyl-CoA dehydratase activase [Candidatus Lernaella stagnicola]|nr:acyl-CoA dehydratase activase [Candidatus Lernaella stagnicola]
MSDPQHAVYAGVDIGSLSTETILMDDQGDILAQNVLLTGASSVKASQKSYAEALAAAGLTAADVTFCVVTGYGRNKSELADARITEITCHAKGASVLFPGVKTVIDIGGQDSKVIRVNGDGSVADFVMNDKCAAGTGRFLEVMARTLEVDLEELGPLALRSDADVKVSSMCTVFAESEVVSLIGDGVPEPRIAWGVCRSVADRSASLAERVRVTEPVVMTGGVAKNPGVVAALEKRLGIKLVIPDNPQIVGALGAAHLARDRVRKNG